MHQSQSVACWIKGYFACSHEVTVCAAVEIQRFQMIQHEWHNSYFFSWVTWLDSAILWLSTVNYTTDCQCHTVTHKKKSQKFSLHLSLKTILDIRVYVTAFGTFKQLLDILSVRLGHHEHKRQHVTSYFTKLCYIVTNISVRPTWDVPRSQGGGRDVKQALNMAVGQIQDILHS